MNRDKFAEDAYLYLLNELSREDKTEFENILMQDDVLNREFQIIRNDFSHFVRSKPEEVDDRLLTSARNELMRKVRGETESPGFINRLKITIRDFFFHNYSLAFGGIATFILGIGIGYMLLISKNIQPNLKINKPVEIQSNQASNENSNGTDNLVSPSEGVKPEKGVTTSKQEPAGDYSPKPNLKESIITNLLGEANPGIRIRNISNISNQAQNGSLKMDPKIKEALLTAMMKDKNPVVRKEAMIVLSRFNFDEKLRDALLYVLSNDSNSGNRVIAINMLTNLKEQGVQIDPVIKNTLTKKAMTDNNSFVKIRAASILKENE